MSFACYIVLDNDDPGFDTFVNGKFLAHEDELEVLCKQLQLKMLEDFLVMSGDDIAGMLDDGMELPEDVELPEGDEEKWFTPEEGLAWVSALTAHIKANPASVNEPQGCLDDLAEYADVLEKARDIDAKWHLALDF